MKLASKIVKWICVLSILFSSFWLGWLAYFAHAFTEDSVKKIEDLEVDVSLATAALAINWPVFIALSLTYLLTAIFLSTKTKTHLILYLLIAISTITITNIANVLVFSAGFELHEHTH